MSSTLESLATLIQDPALTSHATGRMERLRLHIADTLGMMLRGASLAEGKAAMSMGSCLAGWCASARLTEADDIHLISCTTPGSVVVPTALHLASAGLFESWVDFVTAVLAGYETLIRIGYAIDGARILARQIWPTLFAAGASASAGGLPGVEAESITNRWSARHGPFSLYRYCASGHASKFLTMVGAWSGSRTWHPGRQGCNARRSRGRTASGTLLRTDSRSPHLSAPIASRCVDAILLR